MVQSSVVQATFKVVVDYRKSLAEMISAGKYDWPDSDITQKHFPVKGRGQQEVEVALFHFKKIMISKEVIAEMAKGDYRPAEIEKLLALGASQPELQKEFPIVGLGSVWQGPFGFRLVPCLGWRGAGRDLGLRWFEDGWSGRCRFAAVRQSA